MTDAEFDRAIEEAKARFLAQGGSITKLPGAKIPPPDPWNKTQSGAYLSTLSGNGNHHVSRDQS